MRRKLLVAARGVFSLSNHNLRLTRLSHPRSPKWVLIEANSFVGRSNTQWRGRSYAASVPSDKPNSQKGQRLSRHERRVLVESFVNKYREANDGKFPNSTLIMKQVGGSYYVIRDITLELKYKSKLNPSNNIDKNLVGKDNSNASQLETTETVMVSSDTIETAKDKPIQDDCQLAILDENDAGNEHLEDKRGPQTPTHDGSLCREAVITSSPDSQFIAAESDQLQREAEPSKATQWTPIDVKTEEPESSQNSVVSETHPMEEEVHGISALSSEMLGSSPSRGLNTESSDMGNHLVMKKTNIETVEDERIGYDALKDLPGDFSAPSSNMSRSSPRTGLDSELSDVEKPMVMKKTNIEKAEHEITEHDALKDLPGIDGPKHTMEQVHGTSDTYESKADTSNREISDAEAPKKTTLWGNLKSFAHGIMNIWKKL